jgi:hypothetical protein
MYLMMNEMILSMTEEVREECGRKMVWVRGVAAFMVRRLEVDQ